MSTQRINVEAVGEQGPISVPVHARIAEGLGRIAGQFKLTPEERELAGVMTSDQAEIARVTAQKVPAQIENLTGAQQEHARWTQEQLGNRSSSESRV